MTLAATLALAVTTTRASTVTLDWSETGSSFGNGSGTLTIDATSDVGMDSDADIFALTGWDYTIRDFTGSIGSYSGLALYGTSTFVNLSSATVSGSSLLGVFSLLTDANGDGLEIYGGTGSFPPAASSPYVFADFGTSADGGHDTFTLAIPVPEPAPLALATLGGLGLVAFRRRK